MNKDKALEELFLAHKPHFDDGDAFMASLTKRLDAVEYIKQHQEATLRRYKMAMVAALFVGIISGGIAMAFVLSLPTDVPLFNIFGGQGDIANHQLISGILLWLSDNSRLITAAILSLLMTVGGISLFNNIQEISTMRSMMGQQKSANQ